eukprot:1012865-Rhodomonas_salina.3
MASTNASLSASKQVGILGRLRGSSSKPTSCKHMRPSRIVVAACPRYHQNRCFHAARSINTQEVWNVGMGLRARRPAPRGGNALCGIFSQSGAGPSRCECSPRSASRSQCSWWGRKREPRSWGRRREESEAEECSATR